MSFNNDAPWACMLLNAPQPAKWPTFTIVFLIKRPLERVRMIQKPSACDGFWSNIPSQPSLKNFENRPCGSSWVCMFAPKPYVLSSKWSLHAQTQTLKFDQKLYFRKLLKVYVCFKFLCFVVKMKHTYMLSNSSCLKLLLPGECAHAKGLGIKGRQTKIPLR